jgi:hypothetical protein
MTENFTKEETEKTKSSNLFLKIWSDSVLSKLIATGLILILSTIGAYIIENFKKIWIKKLWSIFLSLEIKVYLVLIIALILMVIYFLFLKFIKKQKAYKETLLKTKVGNYRFGELNNILLTTQIKVPDIIKDRIQIDELDLLTLFRLYISQLNTVIDSDHPTNDGEFLYFNLGPKLISYGLCERIPSIKNSREENPKTYSITTSDVGYKFFALIEKLDRYENKKLYKEQYEEQQKNLEKILDDNK